MLYRSLYFLFHDERNVRQVIAELENHMGLDDFQLHAIINEGHTLMETGHPLMEMPGATVHKKSTTAIRVEKILWYVTIAVFTLALIALVLTLLAASWYWVVFFGVIVVAAQASGYLFGNRIPNAQLDRFRTGLEMGDIVLQVDVPRNQVKAVRAFMASHHPDSDTNISNWHVGSLGL